MDLEGIVCKRKDSPYKVTEKPSRYWIKVKNSQYGQLEGREELFERPNVKSADDLSTSLAWINHFCTNVLLQEFFDLLRQRIGWKGLYRLPE